MEIFEQLRGYYSCRGTSGQVRIGNHFYHEDDIGEAIEHLQKMMLTDMPITPLEIFAIRVLMDNANISFETLK